MLNNLWHIIGLGKPITMTHFAGRMVMCLVLGIAWIATSMGDTTFGKVCILFLGMGVGAYMTIITDRLEKMVADLEPKPSPQPDVEQNAVLDPDRDYAINPDNYNWLTVGNYSVRVAHKDKGRAEVKLFRIGREDENPIAEVVGE